MTDKGSSNCVSSGTWAAAGDGGGWIREQIRFHENSIFPRFIACSSSSAGSNTVAPARSARACLMASGQAPMSWATATDKGSMRAPEDSGVGTGTGSAGRAAAPADAGTSCNFNVDGNGSGDAGRIGGSGKGELDRIGATGRKVDA